MSNDKFFEQLEERKEANGKELRKVLFEGFNLVGDQEIPLYKQGTNVIRHFNLTASMLSKLAGQKVSKSNINNITADFDKLNFMIVDNYLILKLNKKGESGSNKWR